LLFFPEIYSERDLVTPGNPGLPTVPPLKEQRERSLFFRCFPFNNGENRKGHLNDLEPVKCTV